MSGSGVNATYDQKGDVLSIAEQSRIVVKDDNGRTSLDSTAGSATLDRLNDVLFMDSAVRVLRGAQVINADKVMARLSPDEEVITYLELRGNATVEGGDGPLQSMKANAIDLDYTDDGMKLERALLNGSASLTTAADEHVSSRRMSGGGGLDVQMAPDGTTMTSLVGHDGVQIELPSVDKAPARNIRARTLNASGEPGRGLNTLRFREDVVFQEGDKASPSFREVRAQSLNASLEGDGLRNAFFSGGVTFKERGFDAAALDARYQPDKNILNLSGLVDRVLPHVADEQIRVDARTIDASLTDHSMTAEGSVRTALTGRPASARKQDSDSGRLPGLLKEGQAASINAERLEYSGGKGRTEYTGNATLVQGDTAIRGDKIVLDQQKGDMVATGSARSTLVLDKGRTDGRADEIRYEETTRTVTYSTAKDAPTTGQGASVPLAQVSGPDGDLRAGKIEVVLARSDNDVERLEAYTRVRMVLGGRTAVGGRMTYHAREERYVMSGDGTSPVSISEAARETTGRNLTFFKSTERIIVDGNETRRTETRPTTSSQPLPATPQPSPATPQPSPAAR
jgi:lipopolysaccharide export system protein LptA